MANPARMREREASLTNVARKVLAAVPIAEAWTMQQVASEVFRQCGSRLDVTTVQGCLKHLLDGDFVRLHSRDSTYQQVHRPQLEDKVVPIMATPPLPIPPLKAVASMTPFEKMAKLADALRGMADELDSIALEVSEKLSAPNEELDRLRQLKDLLRGLT